MQYSDDKLKFTIEFADNGIIVRSQGMITVVDDEDNLKKQYMEIGQFVYGWLIGPALEDAHPTPGHIINGLTAEVTMVPTEIKAK